MKRLALLSLVLPGVVAVPQIAQACGGFFCNRDPIQQQGEQVLFATEADGTVEAHVLINYMGEASEFAWVVPVVSVPELGVGTNEAFQQLMMTTSPAFNVEWTEAGVCDYGYYYYGDPSAGGDAEFAARADEDGVNKVFRGEVGPYDAAILESSDANALLNWLDENGYDVTEQAEDIIATYVETDHVFVALKLRSDQTVGDIQPIVFRFEEGSPCVPIRLTAIAAATDMPVRVWSLGEARAIPSNFLHVRINWAAVDWMNYGWNYNDVVSRAANEAGGNAFTTEYAGNSNIMREKLWWPGRYNLGALRKLEDPVAFMDGLISQGFIGNSQLQAILVRHMPLPDSLAAQGVGEQQFYNDLAYYASYIDYEFDPNAMADELETAIVGPLRNAQALLDSHRYLTRLATFISPEEMTKDPIFDQNPDLPAISNQRTAKATLECGHQGGYGRSPIRFSLPDGTEMRIKPTDGGWYEWPTDLPAASVIEQLTQVGEGDILADNRDDLTGPYRAADEDASSGCACTVGALSPSGLPAIFLAAALLGLALIRRRR